MMRPGPDLPLLLLAACLSAHVGAFHLTPRVSSSAAAAAFYGGGSLQLQLHGEDATLTSTRHRLSRVQMKAMRLPSLPRPAAKPKTATATAALLWIVPPFVRKLPRVFGGSSSSSGSSRLRARARAGTATGTGLGKKPQAPAQARRLAAASSSLSDVAASSVSPSFSPPPPSSPVSSSAPAWYSYQQEASPVPSPLGGLEGGSGEMLQGPGEADTVPIVIKYTGGVGFKSVFLGCARVLKDQFPNVSIRKTIVAPTEQRGSSKKAGLFEVIVGDETFDNKRGEGVYLPMADIAAAIDRLAQRRDKERRAVEAALAAAAAAGQEE